jgi:hypothetical protein
MLTFVSVLAVISIGYDAFITKRILDKYGADGEINPIIKKIAQHNKSSWPPAVAAGGLGLMLLAAASFNPLLLAFYAGMRVDYALRQGYAHMRGLV